MALDRWIAVVILIIALAYGYAAYNYPLLPFERSMPFLPNTLPLALSVLGIVIALFIIFSRRAGPGDAEAEFDLRRLREYRFGQTLSLVGAMILYALLLRPVGFLLATTVFIAGCGTLLGERRFHILIPLAAATAAGIWYLVDAVLGIFLRPWPWFV